MISFLKGALAGATLAFLYAPSRGEETRARARAEIEALLERLEAGIRDVGAVVTEQLGELRVRAEEALQYDEDPAEASPGA